MSRASPKQRADRRARGEAAAVSLPPQCRERNVALKLLNPSTFQYRLTGPFGGSVDYYASTERWCGVDHPEIRGMGLASAFQQLENLEPSGFVGTRPPVGNMVTIFADAAHDHRHQIASWGCWIKADGLDALTTGGVLDYVVANTTVAELAALSKAVRIGLSQQLIKSGQRVMLQSDCVAALACILKAVPNTTHSRAPGTLLDVGPARRMQKAIAECKPLTDLKLAAEAYDLKLIVRHVKGHQNVDHGRAWVNKKVDRIAITLLREHRKTLAHGGAHAQTLP